MEDLKGSELEKAIGRLDATAVAGFVQPSGSRTAKEVVDTLWKSESLLDKHGTKKDWPARRKSFIANVALALTSLDADAAATLQALPDLLNTVDINFAKILDQTGKSAGAALPPITQVAAEKPCPTGHQDPFCSEMRLWFIHLIILRLTLQAGLAKNSGELMMRKRTKRVR